MVNKEGNCSRCGRFALLFPHNNNTEWLCQKCKDEWSKIYQKNLADKGDDVAFWKLWEKVYREFMKVKEREKVVFT